MRGRAATPPASRGVSRRDVHADARLRVGRPGLHDGSRSRRGSRTGTGIANASPVPAPRTCTVAVAMPVPFATIGKRYAFVMLSSGVSERRRRGPACRSPGTRAARRARRRRAALPAAPVPLVTATPASNRSPGRANCGTTGFATSGFVVRNVVSPLPKRPSARRGDDHHAPRRQIVGQRERRDRVAVRVGAQRAGEIRERGERVPDARVRFFAREPAAEAPALLHRPRGRRAARARCGCRRSASRSAGRRRRTSPDRADGSRSAAARRR